MPRTNVKTALMLSLSVSILAGSAGLAGLNLFADGKAPIEPPAKARAFKSNLPLLVYQIVEGEQLKLLGQTGPGVARAVNIPAGADWLVQPLATGGVGFGGGALGQVGNIGGGLQVGVLGAGGMAPPGGLQLGLMVGGFAGGAVGKLPKGKLPPRPVFGMKLEGDGLKALVNEVKKQSIPGLVLDFPPVSADDFARIANVAGLRSLVLRGSSGVKGEHLAKLESARNLRYLALENLQLTDDDVKLLAKIPNLSELQMSGDNVSGKGLEAIKGIKKLAALRRTMGAKEGDGLGFLKSLTSLNRLELVGGYTDTDLKALKDITGLEVVRLFQTATTDDAIDLLKGNKNLRVLTLNGHWTPNNMNQFALVDGGKVKWQILNGFGIGGGGFGGGFGGGIGPAPQFTARSLEKLASFEKLAEITVVNNKFKDDDLAPLAKLTRLKRLTLFAPDVGDAGIARLKPLTRLELLDLKGTDMTTAAAASLKPLTSLKWIRVNLIADNAAHKKKIAMWKAALPRTMIIPIPAAMAMPGGGFGGIR